MYLTIAMHGVKPTISYLVGSSPTNSPQNCMERLTFPARRIEDQTDRLQLNKSIKLFFK